MPSVTRASAERGGSMINCPLGFFWVNYKMQHDKFINIWLQSEIKNISFINLLDR